MKRLKRILPIIIAIFMIIITLTDCNNKAVSTITPPEKPVKVSAFLQYFTDDLISEIRQDLEAIQKENPNKVEYTFYDGKSNQAIQDEVLKEGTDLILLNIVNRWDVQTVINRIKENNIQIANKSYTSKLKESFMKKTSKQLLILIVIINFIGIIMEVTATGNGNVTRINNLNWKIYTLLLTK